MNEIILSERMPVLALRGMTVFPGATMHFDVGRTKSIRALDKAMGGDQRIFLVTQKRIEDDDPDRSGLYSVGTVAQVRQVLKVSGDAVRVLVCGEYRARLVEMKQNSSYLCARVESLPDTEYSVGSPKVKALIRIAARLFDEFTELSQRPMQDVMLKLLSMSDPGQIADLIGQAATFGYAEKMQILSQLNPIKRLDLALHLLSDELEVLRMESELNELTQQSIDKGQRDYYLREQMKVIRSELGEGDEDAEIDEYRAKLHRAQLPKEAAEKVEKELQRLAKQPYGSSEASVIRSYLDIVFDLPWQKRTKERLNVNAARKILDADHFGLQKVKERILETLAVRELEPDSRVRFFALSVLRASARRPLP